MSTSGYRVTFLHNVVDPSSGVKMLQTMFNNVPGELVTAMDNTGVFHIGGTPLDSARGVRIYRENVIWMDVVPMSVFGPPVGTAAARGFNPDDVDTKVHLSLAE